MKRANFLTAIFLLTATASLAAQAPNPLPVTGNLGGIIGTGLPYPGVSIQLQNCASPVSITGYQVIVQQQYQVQANASGVINTTVWPNDIINCNGTTGNSQYMLSYVAGGVVQGTPQCFQVVSTQGTWNLNTQQPIACSQSPPNPQDGQFRNVNVTNCLSILGGPCNGSSGSYVSTVLTPTQTIVSPLVSLNTTIGSAAGDAATLGSNLANAGNTTATGWTGAFPNFTNGAPNTGTISTSLTGLTVGKTYYVIIGNVGSSAGSISATFEGTDLGIGLSYCFLNSSTSAYNCSIVASATSGSLVITPTSSYNGSTGTSPNAGISVQLDTPITNVPFAIKDSFGVVSAQMLGLGGVGNNFSMGGNTFGIPSSGAAQSPNYANEYFGDETVGQANVLGAYNTCAGWRSCQSGTNLIRVTSFGNESLTALLYGQNITSVGQGPGFSLVNAINDNLFGNDIMVGATGGSFNSIMGTADFHNCTGASCVDEAAVGEQDYYFCITCSLDVGLGAFAGDGPFLTGTYPYANTSGSQDIFIGTYSSACSATQISDSTVIAQGNQAGTTGACATSSHEFVAGDSTQTQGYFGSEAGAMALHAQSFNGSAVTLTQVGTAGQPAGAPSTTGGTIPASTTNYLIVFGSTAGNITGGLVQAGTNGPISLTSAAVTTTGTTSSIAWTWVGASNVSTVGNNYIIRLCAGGTCGSGSQTANFSHYYFVTATGCPAACTWTQMLPATSYSGCGGSGCALLDAGNQTGIETTAGAIVADPAFGSGQVNGYVYCETNGGPTTLSGASTTTGQTCLPPNSVIDSITYRVTTTITTSASFTIGDSGSATRYATCYFSGGSQSMTAGATGVCNNGTYQVGGTALGVKITPNANPGAGAIRLIVYYHTWNPPTS